MKRGTIKVIHNRSGGVIVQETLDDKIINYSAGDWKNELAKRKAEDEAEVLKTREAEAKEKEKAEKKEAKKTTKKVVKKVVKKTVKKTKKK